MISRFKRVNSQFEFGSTLDRLKIYQKLGLDSVDTVVDIGVSDGRFLMASKELFPHVKRKIGIDPIDEYKKALTVDPGDENLYYNLGRAYMEAKMVDKAIAQFNKALEIYPDFKEALEVLAKIRNL